MLMEMDFFEEIGEMLNNVIREKINIKISVLDYIRYKQLKWYGHVRRMDEERLPQKSLKWKLKMKS